MDGYILKSQAVAALSKYGLSNGSAIGHHSGAVECAIAEIEAINPVDAVPVVHGRWEFGDDGKMHCCSCDKVPTNKILVGGHAILHIADVKQIMKYCPNCGAKMDLEVDGDG